MTDRLRPEEIQGALESNRWTALARSRLSIGELASWDTRLLRDTRVIVPVDVQALYVGASDEVPCVALPFALATPEGQPPAPMPEPFAAGAPRAAGVHLHWAPPDALLQASLQRVGDGARNRLALPALPDRWVVIRILVPSGAATPHVRGWVIEADTAKAVPLESWPAASAATAPLGKPVARDELTGTVGGALSWVGVYDAVLNRFGFHDSLDDLPTVAPAGVVDDLATYVIAGWWSDPKLDPLDGAETTTSLHERLRQLKWRLVEDAEGGDQIKADRTADALRRETIGLETARRYGPAAPAPLLSPEAKAVFRPATSRFADEALRVVPAEPHWPRSTLLHGVVHGVPVRGPVIADQRPPAGSVGAVLGHHDTDLASTMAAVSLGTTAPDERRALERLLSAFTGHLLDRITTADGVVAAEEHEHEAGFVGRPGGLGATERLRPGGTAGPLSAGRMARGDHARARGAMPDATITWVARARSELYKGGVFELRSAIDQWTRPAADVRPAQVREVQRSAPRFFLPLQPLVALRGIKRSLRFRGDGRFSPDGVLSCRWPSQVPTSVHGVVEGRDLIPSLPSGAIPPEVLLLVQSGLVQDPYLAPWLAQVAAARRQLDARATARRLAAEAALRFGANGIYDGGTTAFTAGQPDSPLLRSQVADQLRRFSLVQGVDSDPVGVTAWSQPWIPLWLEWEVALDARDRLDGWTLGQIDLDPATPVTGTPRSITGRSPLHAGTARTLAAAIEAWLRAEEQRDAKNAGEADDRTAAALEHLAGAIEYLDVLTATLDGLGDRLLGLPVDVFGALRARRDDGSIAPAVPIDVPQLLAAGALRVVRVRVLDGFGRTLDVPVDTLRVPARDEIPSEGAVAPALRMRPRLTRPARWLFRLVDPAAAGSAGGGGGDPGGPAEATIDQIDPASMVNPVAGFILPDHIDEALEFFDVAGTPIGQAMHEPFGGGVMWEIAPGRPGPADAGPLFELAPAQQLIGFLAAGMVAADAAARSGQVADPGKESALSAFLRAIDTTLWSVDTFAHMGNEHIAGLVGRPIAVVRATLRLDIDDDLDALDLADLAKRTAREAAYRAFADRAFPVRLGEITRSDDGLLAFFVDDDYSRVHVVDKVVRDAALEGGRGRGFLAQLGTVPRVPPARPILHPYIVPEDELLVHPGQVLRLTLLMHPAGKVHLTSGILPRKALQLARDWVQPGLSVMAPSARIGPVLVDAQTIRLPKISAFPKDQVWTRRTTATTWKDDPILAATQTALLPDAPSEVQEGYIRVAPSAKGGGGGS